MDKEFVLFINLREYDGDKAGTGETSLGELTDNFYCIKPENAEMTGDMMFIDYIVENGERVGVRLLCDPGYVNEANAPLIAKLKLGGKYKFAHTDRAKAGSVGRIRGYTLKLYEAGHEHDHEHEHEHEHGHEHDCEHESCHDCEYGCEHRHD